MRKKNMGRHRFVARNHDNKQNDIIKKKEKFENKKEKRRERKRT